MTLRGTPSPPLSPPLSPPSQPQTLQQVTFSTNVPLNKGMLVRLSGFNDGEPATCHAISGRMYFREPASQLIIIMMMMMNHTP